MVSFPETYIDLKISLSNFHITLQNVTKYRNKFDKKIPQNKIEQVF